MITIEISDLIGYGLAIASIFYAFLIQSRASREADRLNFELKEEIAKRLEDQKAFEKNLESINDIAFSTLLRIKNFPSDSSGMAAQRESFYSALDSIGKITASSSKLRSLQVEYVFGSDLGAIENSPRCKEVALFSADLQPDIDEPELLLAVAENAEKGRKFTYIVPHRTSQSLLDTFNESLETYFLKHKKARENISVVRLEEDTNDDLFVAGSRALYVMADNARRSIGHSKLAYAEIVIPDEKRGALWRRVTQSDAQRIYEVLCLTRRPTRSLPSPNRGTELDETALQNEGGERSKT